MGKGLSGIESGDIKVYSTDESLDKLYKIFEKVVKKITQEGSDEEIVDLEQEGENKVEEVSPWVKNRVKEGLKNDQRSEDNNN